MSSHQISVIIPTHGRPRGLAKCLMALSSQNFSRVCYEAIIVSDGDPSDLGPVVHPFEEHFDVRLIAQSRTGPASARNRGAAVAVGQYLAFTDDDCTPSADWLRALAMRFGQDPANAVGGRTVNVVNRNACSEASQLLVDYLYRHYNPTPQKAHFLASNNFAVPSQMFHEIGGFDETIPVTGGEDRDFCDRWIHHGYGMTYAPEAIVCHHHNMSLRGFLQQHFNYGRGARLFHQRRAQRNRDRIRVEPLAFYLNLLRSPYASSFSSRATVLSALLFISQLANGAGFAWESATQRFGRRKTDPR